MNEQQKGSVFFFALYETIFSALPKNNHDFPSSALILPHVTSAFIPPNSPPPFLCTFYPFRSPFLSFFLFPPKIADPESGAFLHLDPG
jgi:hypothetical protein